MILPLEFSLGALLYCQLNSFRRSATTATSLVFAGITVAALVAELALGANERTARTIAVSSGFALLLGGLRRWDDALMRARLLQPLIRCGRISYSIYLIHMPISLTIAQFIPSSDTSGAWPLLLIGVPAGVGVSVVAGWGLYQIAEAPLLRRRSTPTCGPENRI